MSWNEVIGLGVAGNFTGHLEQAGEASDFKNIRVTKTNAPKGLFPFFVPNKNRITKSDHFLHCMPISSKIIRLNSLDENHQIEPEVALMCDLVYDENHNVSEIRPRFAMAHNDCSIRRRGAIKISEKKNWGVATKGTSEQKLSIDKFNVGGILDRYRLTSFLLREGQLHSYGVDSFLTGYSYFYTELILWMVERMNQQEDVGPLENISEWLRAAEFPEKALISIGATRYTRYGENTFLKPGDRAIVMLYDAQRYTPENITAFATNPSASQQPGLSVLNQLVEAP